MTLYLCPDDDIRSVPRFTGREEYIHLPKYHTRLLSYTIGYEETFMCGAQTAGDEKHDETMGRRPK